MNWLGVICSPSANIIIVLSEIPLVRRCIILLIVGNGTPLSWESLYCVRFFSPIYLHNLSTTTSLIDFIIDLLFFVIIISVP